MIGNLLLCDCLTRSDIIGNVEIHIERSRPRMEYIKKKNMLDIDKDSSYSVLKDCVAKGGGIIRNRDFR